MFLNYVESGLRIIPVPGRSVLGVEENVAKHVTIPGGGGGGRELTMPVKADGDTRSHALFS